MKISQFDAHNKQTITVEVDGSEYDQRIVGEGYFIIINPASKHVSFSKHRQDICMGDVTKEIIKEYTHDQYAAEYGDRPTGYHGMTVREYMVRNCRITLTDYVPSKTEEFLNVIKKVNGLIQRAQFTASEKAKSELLREAIGITSKVVEEN